MLRVPGRGAVVVLTLLLASSARTIELTLDRRALAEAIDLGQTRIEATRSRFHADYRFAAGQPPVDFIDVITPFHKVVLAAERNARYGGRLFGQKEALEALQPYPEQVSIYVDLTFHPMNTYIGVPDYAVTLASPQRGGNAPKPLEPMAVSRLPRYGPRLEGIPYPYTYPQVPPSPAGSQPLTGGTIMTTFDGRLLDPKGAYDVVISDSGKELARVRVDFGRLR